MKSTVFIFALALGMCLGFAAYIAGGLALLVTGLTFTIIIVGCVWAMILQAGRVFIKGNAEQNAVATAF